MSRIKVDLCSRLILRCMRHGDLWLEDFNTMYHGPINVVISSGYRGQMVFIAVRQLFGFLTRMHIYLIIVLYSASRLKTARLSYFDCSPLLTLSTRVFGNIAAEFYLLCTRLDNGLLLLRIEWTIAVV